MPDIQIYRRQHIPPTLRYVVCKRQIGRKTPGMDVPVYEPTIVRSTFDMQEALIAADHVVQGFRDQRFTVCQDLSKPYRFEAFKLSATGEWQDFEIYIAVMSF